MVPSCKSHLFHALVCIMLGFFFNISFFFCCKSRFYNVVTSCKTLLLHCLFSNGLRSGVSKFILAVYRASLHGPILQDLCDTVSWDVINLSKWIPTRDQGDFINFSPKKSFDVEDQKQKESGNLQRSWSATKLGKFQQNRREIAEEEFLSIDFQVCVF